MTDTEGKKISRNAFKNQYLLIHFWASWDAASRQSNKEDLRPLYESLKKEQKLALLGISLDMDRQAWQDAIRHDGLDWTQACDLKGWETDAVKRLNLTGLPSNILVNSKGRIMGINLTPDEVKEKIEEE